MSEAMDIVLNTISKIKGLTLDEAYRIATLIDDDRQSRLKEALIKDYRSPYFTVRPVMEFRAEEHDGDPAAPLSALHFRYYLRYRLSEVHCPVAVIIRQDEDKSRAITILKKHTKLLEGMPEEEWQMRSEQAPDSLRERADDIPF